MSPNVGSALKATFQADAGAPGAARSAIAALNGGLDGEVAFRLRLLVSEAVTNRVLDQAMGGGRGRVRLQVATDDRAVRASVEDVDFADDRPAGSASAAMREIEAGIMGALADSWGTAAAGDGTISIWFELLNTNQPSDIDYAERFAAAVAAHRDVAVL
jgi:hypothetical protein